MKFSSSRRSISVAAFASCAVILAGCSGKDKPADTSAADAAVMATSSKQWEARRKTADSIIKSAPTVAEVAKQKGSKYDVADDALKAAVLKESEKTADCYSKARRDYDPSLAGVADVLVNFGGAGWDIIRVEHATWSSPAGGAVETCIDARAKTEWKLPTKGIRPGAHLVQMTFRPDSANPKPVHAGEK